MVDERPLILTLTFDGATFARLDGLRRRHFPPERNHIPAHLTLFHALPGVEATSVRRDLEAACARQRGFALTATGIRSLGYGVAIAFASAELVAFRQALSREWRDWLTAQDSARIAPHVTIQNKVSTAEASSLKAEMERAFESFTARAEGVALWRYAGGPWEADRRFGFA